MPVVERQALLPYSSDQMFSLVNEVGEYPAFLPWCNFCEILERDQNQMKATVGIEKSGIRQQFTTLNTFECGKSIHMQLIDGPFKKLNGQWLFKDMGSGTSASLHLEFEFASKLLQFSFGPIFKQATDSLLQAFIDRARDVYA